jgi:hypothetical protein
MAGRKRIDLDMVFGSTPRARSLSIGLLAPVLVLAGISACPGLRAQEGSSGNVSAGKPSAAPPVLVSGPQLEHASQAPPQSLPASISTAKGALPKTGEKVQNSVLQQALKIAPIAPGTPVKELLPRSPVHKDPVGPAIVKDLAQIPEVEFQFPLSKNLPRVEARKQTATMLARINHLNRQSAEGFLSALKGDRLDLAGLPFAMGDACRTKGEHSRQFAQEVALIRGSNTITFNTLVLAQPAFAVPASSSNLAPVPPPPVPASGSAPVPPPPAQPPLQGPAPVPALAESQPVLVATAQPRSPEEFWSRYPTLCAEKDKKLSPIDRNLRDTVIVARIAALMQVLSPQSPAMRAGLVKFLSTISHVEATRALARLAIFSREDEVRLAAVDALKTRRERDYTDILLQGLRYPLPDVAVRAADSLVKLERTDLVPELVAILAEPDPRAPVVAGRQGKKEMTVRELVRVNHHRNCLLCHAPANTGDVAPDTLTAAIPLPADPLPSPSQGYQTSDPELIVRVDVMYLRQDFSLMQPVTDAHPWPEMQRFDYLVRKRVLTDKEADAYRQKLENLEPGRRSPYQRAILSALRELTGKDAEPTPDAWRRLLNLAEKQRRLASAL